MRFQFGDHELDTDRRALTRGGAPVGLEPQVFDLLAHLLRHRDRVISKDDLIAAIWNGRIVSDATIDSRVMAARKAVGDDGVRQTMIRTFARKGIRFVADVVLVNGERSAAPQTVTLAREGRPSIAVLPFENLSGDGADMAFADGVTEDIITTLSHADTLLVIARNSCFSYKGRVVDVKDVGRELVVRYVLTGSVRRAGDRVRIAAHLAETENGVHIWADRYDRTMTDVFAVQDDIAASVSQVILPMVAVAERRRAATRDPTMPDAWESYQRALAHWAAQDSAAALVTLRRTLALDDGFAPAHAVMADVMISIGHRGLIPWREASEVGDYHARRAIALDPDLPDGHALLSRSALMRGDPESALIHAETAVALGPNSVNALIARGQVLVSLGRHEAGRRDLRLARRLNPMDPATRIVDMVIGSSLFLNGEFEESAAHLRGLVLAYPRYSAAHFWLLAALGRRGVHDEARRVMERLHELAPRLLGMFADGHHRWYRPEDHAAVMQGFRAAGWRG